MEKYLVGIDIGGTSVKIGVFDLERTLVKTFDMPTNTKENGKYILRDIYNEISNNLDINQVLGYGFGVPGACKDDIVYGCVNLGWGTVNVKEEFNKFFNKETIVKVGNDANVAALGEVLYGAAKGAMNACFITLGTGVGGGIIIDGKIREGMFGAAGEVGHMHLDFDYNFECNCGGVGCLETVASATGIVNVANEFLKEYHGDSVLKDVPHLSAKKVIDAAKDNDDLALKIMDKVTSYLGHLCSVLTTTLNPEVIIFGGGVSNAGEFLRAKIEEKFKAISTPMILTSIKIATLKNDAGIYGAMGLINEEINF